MKSKGKIKVNPKFVRNLFSILIFLSLAVAIGVISRHLPEIRGYFRKRKPSSGKKFFLLAFFANLGKKIGVAVLALAEVVIKKFKNLLHLAHFWLIKLRKRKQASEELREIEAKMELLEEEEKTLEKVINDDLGREGEDSLSEREKLEESFRRRTLETRQNGICQKAAELIGEKKIVIQDEPADFEASVVEKETIIQSAAEPKREGASRRDQLMDQKIDRFFSSDEQASGQRSWPEEQDFSQSSFEQSAVEEDFSQRQSSPEQFSDQEEPVGEEQSPSQSEPVKVGFFSRVANRFKLGAFKKKPDWEKEDEYFPSDRSEAGAPEDDFSDGIVKVGEVSAADENFYQEESNLIKEVVKVKKKEEYSDEDLGIDREILERKIIAKITANPKDQENYRQLGDLYLKMENFRDAEECYQQILKIKPRDVAAKRKLEKVRLLKRLRHQR